MRYLFFISVLILSYLWATPVISASEHASEANEMLLSKLDSILADHQALVAQKEIRINGLRRALDKAKSAAEKLSIMSQLYDEYLVYDSDSALRYASESYSIVSETTPADYDMLTEWILNTTFIYTVQGLYDQAMQSLVTIDLQRLSPRLKAKYFDTLSYVYSMRSVYLRSNYDIWREDIDKANQYRDSIKALDLSDNDDWLWIPVAMAVDNHPAAVEEVDVTRLRQLVDGAVTPTRQNAINAYWLARYYETTGNEELMVRYLTIAATNDALIVNREIAALQELATHLFHNGGLNRAYSYLLYTADQANRYHNRYRLVSLSDILPTVRDAYRIEIEKRDRHLSRMVIILAVLSTVLLASIIFIVIEYSRLKKTRNLLNEANKELSISITERDSAIARLQTANNELAEANKQKIGLLAYAFRLTTRYIEAMDEYRRGLLKKYKANRMADLGALINDPELSREQYQAFYESFDSTILSLFPDFVEQYNASVAPELRTDPEVIGKTRTLNTRLRIHALRRLGIDKSADIARMLNISIRTVYNNR